MNVAMLRNQLPREKWVSRITTAWQKHVTDIFEVGTLLESAKEELKHGEWMTMIKDELPFKKSTSAALMKIAKCDSLRDFQHVGNLPAHWGTLADLTTLTTEQFEHGITTGAINPKMQRKDVKALRGDNEEIKKKKGKSAKLEIPLDVLEVCANFSIQITATSDRLSKEQRAEFFASLRAAIEALEKEQANG